MDFHEVGENLKSDPEENLRSYWEATGKYMRIALNNEQMRQELLQAQRRRAAGMSAIAETVLQKPHILPFGLYKIQMLWISTRLGKT